MFFLNCLIWGGKIFTSPDVSRILGSIGINIGTDSCENAFASFNDQMICDIFYLLPLPQETQDLSYNFSQVLIQQHTLSLHSLSDELEATFLS